MFPCSPLRLEREWRRLQFAQAHQRALARWAKTDWERGQAAVESVRLTNLLLDLHSLRQDLARERTRL